MRRNPLLYSDSSEIPLAETSSHKEKPKKASPFFYFIILANSLLVLFVLGFIWFLFFKSPDLQIKEISNHFFGTNKPISIIKQDTSDAQTNITLTPNQQEKDETQQAKLKQMRREEELAEKTQLEKIKVELESQKIRANEAKRSLSSLQKQKGERNTTNQDSTVMSTTEAPIKAEQTVTNDRPVKSFLKPKTTHQKDKPKKPSNKLEKPTTNSQVDLIMEALKKQ